MVWRQHGHRRATSVAARGRLGLIAGCLLLALLAGDVGSAAARGLARGRLGSNVSLVVTNGQYGPSDLSRASRAGLGLARVQLIQGGDADPVVALAAAAHLRVYPVMGLPQQLSPGAAASAMAGYVTAFAERYGPRG